MAQTMANFDAVLKEFYEDSLVKTINNDVPLFRVLEQSEKAWSGRRVIGSVHTSRNAGVGARAEQGTLPTAGQQGFQQSIVSATYQYGRGTITGQAMAAGKNAFVEAMSVELEGLRMDLTNSLGRQTWGDGTGRLCMVGTDSVTGTNSAISVLNRFATPGHPGARYISQGMLLDGGINTDHDQGMADGTVQTVSIAQSSAATQDTVTVDITAVVLSASADFLYTAGIPDVANTELMGLRGLIDEFTSSNPFGSNAYAGSSVQGINRASVSAWNSIVLGNAGTERSLTADLIQTAFDRIHEESGEEADIIMGHHSVCRALFTELANDRRFVAPGAGVQGFDGGFSRLSFNGVPVERDRLAPYNELFIFKRDAIKLYTLKPLGFADDDGAILSRVANQDSWEFFIRYYGNMGLDKNPKSCAVIRDIR